MPEGGEQLSLLPNDTLFVEDRMDGWVAYRWILGTIYFRWISKELKAF